MKYQELVVETFINFVDPADKYADAAKAWSFKRAGNLNGLAIVRTVHPGSIAQGVQEFFVIDDKRAVATMFLAPYERPKGMQVRYIAVTPSHRGQGIARRLYLWLLGKAVTLVSDFERSAEGTAIWRWLAQQPQVSVTAFPATGASDEQAVADEMWNDPDKWMFVARKRR
jgi:GNAT superfamily N-acetyltransferase